MELIKKLREKTNAGISDCKKALDEANNDFDKAVEILRKKGIAKASKRSEREAAQGIIKVLTNDEKTEGYIMELNAETDFVVRNEKFQDLADMVMDAIVEKKPTSMEELLDLEIEDGTVKDNIDHLSGLIGEKIKVKKFDILTSGGTVADYSHMGGRIGVLVSLNQLNKADLANDIAMQVAAANPKYISPEEVPAEELEKEKEIYREQLKREGKPDNIIEKIMEGKIAKYYEEVCLIKQEFIKDDKKKVQDILGPVKVDTFIRYSL